MNNQTKRFVKSLQFVAENVRPNVPELPATLDAVESWNHLHAQALDEKSTALELLRSPEVRSMIERLEPKMGLSKPYTNIAPVLEEWVVRIQHLKEALDEYVGERWLSDLLAATYRNNYLGAAANSKQPRKRRIQRELKRGVKRVAKEESYSYPPQSSKMDEYHIKIISDFASDLQMLVDSDETDAVSSDKVSEKQRLIENDPVIQRRLQLLTRIKVDQKNCEICFDNETFSGLSIPQVTFFAQAIKNWPLPVVLSQHDLRLSRLKKDLPSKLRNLIDDEAKSIDVTKLSQKLA